MSVFHRVAASLLCTVFACGVAQAQEKKAPAPTYVVAMVGDALQVMAKTDFEAQKKAADAEHHKAQDAWEKDKKAAEAAKKEFKNPAPKAKVFEQKGGDHTNKADAEAAMAKMKKEAEDAKKGKDDPKKGK